MEFRPEKNPTNDGFGMQSTTVEWRYSMEYNQTFAMAEAIALVALTAWLFYLNSSSSRRDSDSKDEERRDQDDGPDETGRS